MGFVVVVLSIVAVAVVLYLVVAFAFGPGEPPPSGEPVASPLPQDRSMTAHDLRAATFPVAMRGYRMADVDALIERMARELEQRPDVQAPEPESPARQQSRAPASETVNANPVSDEQSP